MGKHAAGAVVERHQPPPPAGLTDAQVDAELERQAVRKLRERVREDYGDDAVATLGDLMQESKNDFVRRLAAKDLLEIGYGKVADTPQAVQPAQQGPRIVVQVLRLSSPNTEPEAIDVQQTVEEALEDAQDVLEDDAVQQALSFSSEEAP